MAAHTIRTQDVGKELSDMRGLCAERKTIPFLIDLWIILWTSFFLLTGLTGCQASGLIRENRELKELPALESSGRESQEEDTGQEEIYVHVCGEVKEAGLYRLPSGSRAADAIEAAGGFSKKADRNIWNLALILEDGMQIYVPRKGEAVDPSSLSDSGSSGLRGSDYASNSGSGKDDPGKVNINTASQEELMTLNGIGKSRAADIIAYRSTNGAFTKIEDIRNVSGIGDSIFDKIKDKITVS